MSDRALFVSFGVLAVLCFGICAAGIAFTLINHL